MTNPNSGSDKAVKDFLAEAEEIVDQLAAELADLADSNSTGEADPDLINSIFRGAHSLKGISGMFGFKEISELSHHMENLLDCLRLGKVPLDNTIMGVLYECMELLSEIIRSIALGGDTEHATEISACINSINACLDHDKSQGDAVSPLNLLGLPERVLSSLTEYEEHRLLDNLSRGKRVYSVHASFEMLSFDTDLATLTDLLKGFGEVLSTLPGVGENMETHIDFDILLGTSGQIEEIGWSPANGSVVLKLLYAPAAGDAAPVSSAKEQHATPPDKALPLATSVVSVPVGTAVAAGMDRAVSAKSVSRTVRVDISKLDELMNIVGELVLAHKSIADVAGEMLNEGFSRYAVDLGKAAKGLERKLSELQGGVMDIRMVPVGQLYEKMSRIVRKISREQEKKVDLNFYGADTELDKLIVEDISDPMMHIIRNAIDHGVESPEARLKSGKSEKGSITISSYQKGNHVVIEIEDDGNGIDVEKVKKRALQQGLVDDVDNVSDRDALDFIFLPGFSTTENVSDVSGRGVGMDVVRNNIAAISGMVDIRTQKGAGTCFTITLPITLAIIKVLVVACAGRSYAVPITSVLETLLLKENEIETVERREVIKLRDFTLPLLRLDRFFGLSAPSTDRSSESFVIVVGAAEKRLGIVVDDLKGQQDIVIKSLGEAFRGYRGISGAADLGDLSTILVLDVAGIINEARHN